MLIVPRQAHMGQSESGIELCGTFIARAALLKRCRGSFCSIDDELRSDKLHKQQRRI